MPATLYDFLSDILVGSVSSSVSKTVMAPVERLKILLQTLPIPVDKNLHLNSYKNVQKAAFSNTISVLYQQGFFSLWRGNVANVIRYFPNQALSLAMKDQLKEKFLPPANHKWTNMDLAKVFIGNLAAGGLAGGVCLAGTYPLDLIRTRISGDRSIPSSSSSLSRGILETGRMVFNEGLNGTHGSRRLFGRSLPPVVDGVVALYQGFGVSLFGVVVYKAMHLGGYEIVKEMWDKYGFNQAGNKSGPSIQMSFGFAWVWSLISGTICYPLDTIRRRMMIQTRNDAGNYQYRGGYDCFRSLLREEGVQSLFRGVGVNMVRSFGGAITLVAYDNLKVIFHT